MFHKAIIQWKCTD